MARIGIYMPAHNVAKYISDTIRSIYAQDFDDWEMVVLDDASEDGTFDAAAAALEGMEDGRGRTFLSRNGERTRLIGKLKNEAIATLDECAGGHKYICHVGADDMITPDCLSSCVRFMEDNPELAAMCSSFECFDDQGKTWMMNHVSGSGEFDRQTLLRYMNFFPMRFYRRDAVRAVGGYSNELSSAVDYDLALRLDEKFPGKLKRLRRMLYRYRQHPTQVSRKDRPEQDLNAKRALQAALDRRGAGLRVMNDMPPFVVESPSPDHFIWGG
jgi:alpha-1,6-rhamnosyltransferase